MALQNEARYLNIFGAGVQSILDQLFHCCCKIDDNLPAGYSVDNILRDRSDTL